MTALREPWTMPKQSHPRLAPGVTLLHAAHLVRQGDTMFVIYALVSLCLSPPPLPLPLAPPLPAAWPLPLSRGPSEGERLRVLPRCGFMSLSRSPRHL